MRVLNAAQMREADRRTIEEIGIPSRVLMENAGREVVAAIAGRYEDLETRRVAVLCGRGSNGGDGYVVARTLSQRGLDVRVYAIGGAAEIRGDAGSNLEILRRMGLTVADVADEQSWRRHFPGIAACGLIVDAILGTGLNAPLAGLLETVVVDLNRSKVPVVAVDLPSGVSGDKSDLIGACVRADMTVTLAAPKLPLVLPPAEAEAGHVVVADIGISRAVIERIEGPRVDLLTREAMRDLVQPRQPDAHKGSFGHVLIVAGSRGKSGAAQLAATGALRSGAGLVTIATPASAQAVVASMAPEYMTVALEETRDGTVAARALDRVLTLEGDVVAAGPGLGTGTDTTAFVLGLLARGGTALVLDADALNAVAGDPQHLRGRPGRTVVITPHPGEMARLAGVSTAQVQLNRLDVARDFATAHQVYVILKGQRTLVATPEGVVFINPLGNPGMATGGTGDVLTGVVAAWLGQGLEPGAACCLAVYLHALAGDLSSADEGEIAMTAGDVASRLGEAILDLTAAGSGAPRSYEE
jgi:ADP-dependent NAD(P)H-hydrate dehydratase / NAD(P)H-hydrate epimerase